MSPQDDAAGDGDSGAPPDAGVVEPVPGTSTGLLREVGRMADGRRVTYYTLPARSPSSGTRSGGGA